MTTTTAPLANTSTLQGNTMSLERILENMDIFTSEAVLRGIGEILDRSEVVTRQEVQDLIDKSQSESQG